MARHNLKIRQVDRAFFDSIRSGQKTIETRAATDKYRKIRAGDVLVFICGDQRLEKLVESVGYYRNIDEIVKAIDFKSIAPVSYTHLTLPTN